MGNSPKLDLYLRICQAQEAQKNVRKMSDKNFLKICKICKKMQKIQISRGVVGRLILCLQFWIGTSYTFLKLQTENYSNKNSARNLRFLIFFTIFIIFWRGYGKSPLRKIDQLGIFSITVIDEKSASYEFFEKKF